MKKFLSAILACSMLLGCMPLSVFAQDAEQIPAETAAIETTAEPAETAAATDAVTEPAETEAATEAAAVPAETEPATEAAVPAAKTVKVTFVCEPAEMILTVYAVNGEEKTLVKAADEKTYDLLPGTYCYTAELAGYEAAEEAFSVKASEEPVSIAVALTALEKEAVPETSEETVPETSEETVPETSEETVPETTEETVPETTEEMAEGELPVEHVDEALMNKEPVRVPGDDKNNDELYDQFVAREFYHTAEGRQDVSYGYACRSELTQSQKYLYDLARGYVSKLAHGQATYTVMTENVVVSASELGIRSVGSNKNGYFTPSYELNRILENAEYEPWSDVVIAIMGDMPYDHYWMDRSYATGGWIVYYPYVVSGNASNNTVTLATKVLVMAAQKYATSKTENIGGRYCHLTLNTAMTGAGSVAAKAGAKAKQVAASASGMSDLDKMIYFADYIMQAVEYDYDALYTGPTAANGSGAWSIINTFDENPATNIVCEGYAKSFQYLCDLSSFNGDIEVYQDSGDAIFPDGGGGPHMWNVVNIDGVKLLTDLTPEDYNFFLCPVKMNSTYPVYYELPGLCGYKGGKYIPAEAKNVPTSLNLNLPAPKANAKAVTSLNPAGFKVNIQWMPAPVNGVFQPGVAYTAKILVIPTVNPIFKDFKLVVGGKTLSTDLSNRGISRIAEIKFPATTRTSGWYQENGHWRYYFDNGTYAKNQWINLGSWYHFDSNGYMQTGWQKIDGYYYHFDTTGRMSLGWTYLNGYFYYFDAAGHMVSGWQNIGGQRYHFMSDGRMNTGWLYLDGYFYYFNASGYMQTGWQTIGGHTYYFQNDGRMHMGWLYQSGYFYYFDGSGYMATGWKTVGSQNYHFDAKGHMSIGWAYLGGYFYYFDASGRYLTGWQTVGGHRYHFMNDGRMNVGWAYLNGYFYFFNASGYYVTGWQNIAGHTYYFQNDGRMHMGWLYVNGYYYYFDASGYMVTGWYQVGGYTYYFNQSGKMLKGRQNIGGKTYIFDDSGHLIK